MASENPQGPFEMLDQLLIRESIRAGVQQSVMLDTTSSVRIQSAD